MMQAGAILGALAAGWACDRFGRRISIAIAGALLVVGAVVCVSASDSGDGVAAATGATQPCSSVTDCIPLVGAGHSRFCSYYAKDTCVGGSTCAGQCDLCSACWADSDALGGSCTAECGAPSPPPPSRGGRIFALIAGRFLAGMGMGAASHSVPVFTSELAEASVRGALGASFQVAICIGLLIAYLLNMQLLPEPRGWVWSLAMPIPAGATLIATLYVLPESPRWLATRGTVRRPLTVAAFLAISRNSNLAVANRTPRASRRFCVRCGHQAQQLRLKPRRLWRRCHRGASWSYEWRCVSWPRRDLFGRSLSSAGGCRR